MNTTYSDHNPISEMNLESGTLVIIFFFGLRKNKTRMINTHHNIFVVTRKETFQQQNP